MFWTPYLHKTKGTYPAPHGTAGRSHFKRNPLTHACRRFVSAFFAATFVQDNAEEAEPDGATWQTSSAPKCSVPPSWRPTSCLLGLPDPTSHQAAALDQPTEVSRRRDQAPDRCHWHLPSNAAHSSYDAIILRRTTGGWSRGRYMTL